MERSEYDDLLESLYLNHEAEFAYNGKEYSYDTTGDGYQFYKIAPLPYKCIERVYELDDKTRVDKFLASKCFEGTSLRDNWQNIEILIIF